MCLHQSLHKSTHSPSVFGGQKLAVYAFCLREYTENCQQSAKNSDSRPGCFVQVFWNDCTCTSITANYIPKIPKVSESNIDISTRHPRSENLQNADPTDPFPTFARVYFPLSDHTFKVSFLYHNLSSKLRISLCNQQKQE